MSSPVHHAKDLDAALVYAPPWARMVGSLTPRRPSGPLTDDRPMDRPVEGAGPTFVGDRAALALRWRLSLEPEIVPRPPMPIARNLAIRRRSRRLCAAASIAGLASWAIVSIPSARPAESGFTQADVAPLVAVSRVMLIPVQTKTAPASVAQTALAVQDDTPSPAQALVAAISPSPLPPIGNGSGLAEHSVPAPATDDGPALDHEEIAALVKRGKEHLVDGDVAAARLLLQCAADAGSAEAALSLGATFDPSAIKQSGEIGIDTDLTRARQWYQKAAALGSDLASQQLARLARARE
jgi:hypothetical protein